MGTRGTRPARVRALVAAAVAVALVALIRVLHVLHVQERRDREAALEREEMQVRFDILAKRAVIEARLKSPRASPAVGDAAAGDFPMRWPMSQPENAAGHPERGRGHDVSHR